MEESSEAHMETDVSSTTDDVLESQEVSASNDKVEMVILLEDTSISTVDSEEQPMKMEEDVSSASPAEEKPAEMTPQSSEVSNLLLKSPTKSSDVSKPIQKTPVKEVVGKSPQKPATSRSPVKLVTQSVITVQEAQCADSTDSAKNEIPPVPAKPVVKTTELSPDKTSDKLKSLVLKSPLRVYKPAEKNTLKDVPIVEKSVTEIISETEQKVLVETSKEKVSAETTINKIPADTIVMKVSVEVAKQKIPVEMAKQKIPVEMAKQKVPVEMIKHTVPVEVTKQKGSVEIKNKKIPIETTNQKVPIEITKQKVPGETTKQSPIKETPLSSSNVNGKVPTVIEKEETKPVQEPEMSMEIDKEGSNSQASDTSEKEHNKSISRELKSLINSAKESKIISECNQVTSKTRKSRTNLDTSIEADKIQGNRRGSNNSLISNSSEKSDKAMQKRSMRSQNPEFVSKCKQFMNLVTAKVMKDSDEAMSEDDTESKEKEKPKEPSSAPSTPKRKKLDIQDLDKQNKLRSDPYCWRCHYIVEYEENEKAHPPIMCTVCPRSFHYKCLTGNERKVVPEKNWVCPDCLQILQAESSETRSPAMKKITLGMLCELLKYALERMMDINGVTPFINPVDRTAFPDYDKYVVHPMDLTLMKQNIADGNYGSTEAFIADAQWILHNSIIFNTCEQVFLQSKLTGGARALVRSCRAEMGEIEACPECYSGAHARKSTWFTDVCSTPHILLWAKLKGFPYWPAKGMTVNTSGLVDVRFFGAHDRAWVPAKDCFLYSEKDPNNFRTKRQDILDSMQEAEEHIRNISRKYGKFVYPPFKTQFDPIKMTEQLKMMIPTFEGEIKIPPSLKEKLNSSPAASSKDKRRSNSKSSKSSANDGDTSEYDDSSIKKSESTCDTSKEGTIDTETTDTTSTKIPKTEATSSPKQSESLPSRKRRRSNLEEAVLTIMETVEKKKKVDEKPTDNTQTESSKEEKTDKVPQNNKITTEKSDIENTEVSKKTEDPKATPKDNEPSSSTVEELESLRVTPIKLVALPRTDKQTPKLFTTTKVTSKPSTPKADDKEKAPQKLKQTKLDKSLVHDKSKEKRRHSRRSSRSSISATSTPKPDKTVEKKTDSDSSTSKENKTKEVTLKRKNSNVSDKSSSKSSTSSPKTSKDRIQFDENTSLAVLARKTRQQTNSGLPTISNVCSLSTTAQNTNTTSTTNNSKTIEVTIEPNNDKSVFTPTSTDNVTTMKDAVSKLQKLRNDTEPMVGRVGVKAFARMTSPNRNNDVQVEIKAEPIDLDEIDEERQMEKMDLMNACKLRPVNQVQAKPQNTRDMRVNKVVVQPTVVAKKTGRVEVRPRAKKTFPPPRRNDGTVEGSSLNGKNSMVYIPIQPPATQSPVRHIRPNGPNAGLRQIQSVTSANSIVNTVTSPLRPTLSTPTSSSTITTPTMGNAVGPLANVGNVTNIGQVPTTVHTVPLMTSVNGQWMFSLQPVMSVGGLDNPATSPVVNGLPPERAAPAQPLVTITPNSAQNKSNESTTPSELPRLQQRPVLTNPLDSNASLGAVPTPSSAGPLTAKLNQNAVKLTDFFRILLEDTIDRIEEPSVQAHALKLQLEQAKWRHQQEIEEMKHNHELTLAEMRMALEKEKLRILNEARKTAQTEMDAAVKSAKTKQWCANCFQEAQFYCCWNTSYCDYPCQRAHWPQHFSVCTQQRVQELDSEDNSDNRRQSQSESLPALQKNGPCKTPTLTVGGKLAPTRVYAQDSAHAPKTSIIVSMVEDTTGNQTMKCVGTYKSPQSTNMQPLIINKQLMNEDSTGKKVVTSGGYLIVGAAGNTTSVLTPATTSARRPQTIQYYT